MNITNSISLVLVNLFGIVPTYSINDPQIWKRKLVKTLPQFRKSHKNADTAKAFITLKGTRSGLSVSAFCVLCHHCCSTNPLCKIRPTPSLKLYINCTAHYSDPAVTAERSQSRGRGHNILKPTMTTGWDTFPSIICLYVWSRAPGAESLVLRVPQEGHCECDRSHCCLLNTLLEYINIWAA